MGYISWPQAQPPYAPNTYVTDRLVPVNNSSLTNGLARDVAAMQHHINTTNLIASGYANPVLSGYFKNIDTLYLSANKIDSRYLYLHYTSNSNIGLINSPNITINATDSAFVGNNISLYNSFQGPGFSLNSNGLVYNASYISGSVWNWFLTNINSSQFLNGLFNNITVVSGNINVDPSHNIYLNTGFSASGSISESGIYWDGFGGHDHKQNNIKANNIVNSDMIIQSDLNIVNNKSSITVQTGKLNAQTFNTKTSYDSSDFYILDYSASGTYYGLRDVISYTYGIGPSGTVYISGKISDLNIGLEKMIVNGGQVIALSKTLPTGCPDTTKTFIYSTYDMLNWQAILISGQFSNSGTFISESGNAYIADIIGVDYGPSNSDLYILWNMSVPSGNYCSLVDYQNMYLGGHGQLYGVRNCAYGASKYGVGLSLIDSNIFVYGYEYPHLNIKGIGQWDKNGYYYNPNGNYNPDFCGAILNSDASAQDISYSGVPCKFSYPFLQVFTQDNIITNMQQPNNYYWIDGSNGSVDGHLTAANNGSVYTFLPGNNVNYSGYYAGFFGNGFSEITSIMSYDAPYHAGKKGMFTFTHQNSFYDGYDYFYDGTDFVDNFVVNPLLVFGNFISQVNTSSNDNIFAGCVPLVMELDRRLPNSIFNSNTNQIYITSGNAIYAPNVLHGARSLMDDTYLMRLPNVLVYDSIIRSNLFAEFVGTAGKYWTDSTNFQGSPGYEAYINPDPLDQKDCHSNICPWLPGYGVTPFCGSGQIYYKHINELTPTKLHYTSSVLDSYGLIIPSGTFTDRNMPTFYDRPNLKGFWSTKTFDWFYNAMPNSNLFGYGLGPNPPSGSYNPTYYYMRPTHPLQHNGVIYCILENNTGFIYTGPDGPQYIDDNIMYSDLIKFGNTIYGVGCLIKQQDTTYTYTIVVTTIKRNISTFVPLPSTNNSILGKKTPKFVIYNNSLYIGLGNGVFLVKKPSHIDLCITDNI